jgi:hypothetical protein
MKIAPMRLAGTAVLALTALLSACHAPDPKAVLEISDIETYWAVDSAQGERQYIAPVARFQVHNKGTANERTVEAQATFRRKGEDAIWSSAWQKVTEPGGHVLPAGSQALVVLKPEYEGRYFTNGPPESMFQHEQFRDASVDVFLRIGSSPWTKFKTVDVERRIGTRSVQASAP